MLTILTVVAVSTVVALALIAYRLQKKVRLMEAKKAEQQRLFEQQQQQQRVAINNSIQVLARGLVAAQLTKTEAAIRISVLLEFLAVSDELKQEFSAFYQLAEATAHIPILQKWQDLSTKQKMQYDNERVSLENKYGDFVIDAAKRVIGRVF